MSPTRKKSAKKKAAATGAKKKKAAASGTKKKAAAGGAKKKAAVKRSPAKAKASRKKAAAPKVAKAAKPAKKAAAKVPKKSAKKTVAPKAGTGAVGKKKAAKPSAPDEAVKQEVVAPESPQSAVVEKEAAAPKKRAPRGKPIPLSEVPHPKFGLKFECFQCQAKFYDLNKPDPLCPKCGADQRDRPRVVIGRPPAKPRKRRATPMVPLLDDEDETSTEAEALQLATPAEGDDMFDDAAAASIDEDEVFEPEEIAPAKPVVVEDPGDV